MPLLETDGPRIPASRRRTDIGDDVEVCIARLLQAAAFDTDLAGVGIVYLDEVDKLAKSDGAGGNGEGRTKDVGGLGVQQVRAPSPRARCSALVLRSALTCESFCARRQALLRLLEGNVVSVTMKGGPDPDAMPPPSSSVHPHSSADLQPSPGRRRKTSPFPSLNGAAGGTGGGFGPSMQASGSKHEQTYSVDTSNVLFIMSGAFVDLDKTILARTRQTGMGFGAVLPKPCKDDEPAAAAAEETGAYRDPSRQEPKTVLDDLELGDLVSYGFIPEFIGPSRLLRLESRWSSRRDALTVLPFVRRSTAGGRLAARPDPDRPPAHPVRAAQLARQAVCPTLPASCAPSAAVDD